MTLNVIVAAAFAVAELIFSTLFCSAGWPESTKKGFYYKMTASSVFLLFGILCSRFAGEETYRNLIIAGLAFGWVGDVFMTLDPFLVNKSKAAKTAAGITGGLAFLTGHICYIIAFVKQLSPVSRRFVCVFVIAAAALMCVVTAIKQGLKVKLGKLTPAVAVYALMLLSMLILAWILAFTGGKSPAFGVTVAAGSLLFVVSDFTLALKLFAGSRFDTLTVRRIYIYTYFFAQLLIAGSLALI